MGTGFFIGFEGMEKSERKTVSDNSISISDIVSVYENNIYVAVDEYIENHNNMDISTDLTQYQYKDLLYYIYDRCFRYNPYIFKNSDNTYNIGLLSNIYNIYKRICVRYNKITFLQDFSILTGIEEEYIVQWVNDNRFNTEGKYLYKKVMRDSETAVSTQMISTGRNPVGYMAILNHYHGWSTTAEAHGVETQRRTPDEIAQAHGIGLETSENTAPPRPVFMGVPQISGENDRE